MERFLLAESPFFPERSGLWIVHLLNPISIFQVVEGRVNPEGKIFGNYTYVNSDGMKEAWTLVVFHFFTTDFISDPDVQALPLLKRAWRWYLSYLKWVDQNISHSEEAQS